MEPNYCYKKDEKLVYSNNDFENELNSSQYDAEAASCIPFPNDYLLAQFAKWAYLETFENLSTDWELLTTARNKKFFNGYFGVSFWNPKLCHVVIAHRGTELSNFGALLSDFKLSFNWNKTNQAESAATFVYEVGKVLKKKMGDGGPRYQLSITGHSLGAWLAQMTTFTLKYFTVQDNKFVEDFSYGLNIHAHTVVFESPGCKKNLEELSKHFVPSFVKRKFGNYYSLDMTVYLSEINYINCINIHVGTVYKIRSTTHSIKDILQEFNPETGEIHKELVLDSKSGFLAAFKAILKPVTKINFKTITANANQHSLNVFDDVEEDFIRDWIYIRDFQPDSIKNVKHPLPYFEVDYEYDLIKGDNIIKTIALIKNYKRTKMFVSNVLSANVLFTMRTDQFKDSLVQYCTGFYIKDKYGLKNFVMSDQQILNISVESDLPDGYRLETSVLKNICTFYNTTEPNLNYFKSGKYNFVSWNILCAVLQSHASIFDNLDISLLIVECGDLNEKDVESINSFLSKVNFKIVILSDSNFPFKENTSVVEVSGFSNNIIFQDLEENSQKRLIKQKSIFLNNKEMSIELLFKFNEDTYNHLNSALPSDLLLRLLTVPDTECLTVDTTYKNILNGITIELYKEVDVNRNNLKSIKNSLMLIENEKKEIMPTDVTNTALSTIFKENVDFEKECLENLSKQSNKIVYLFTKKENKIFLSKIFRSDLYIKRGIAHTRLLKSSIFKDTDANQLFYICGNKDVFDKISAKLNSDKYIYLTEEQAKLKLQTSKAWAHILKLDDDKNIRLLGSKGNVQFLKQHLIMDENLQKPLSEEELANQSIVILSGDAGVGKSSIIKPLYLYLQRTHWVFIIQLAHANFENFILNYNNVARFILHTYGITNEYAQFLLSFCLRYPTNIPIYIIFDGFNEMLSNDSKKIFMDIINLLKYSPNVNILITTRTYACKELENGISVLASYFLPTEIETNVVNYLTKFWFSQMQVLEDKVDFQKLQGLAKSIMKAASKFFGESVPTFLGIPLHIRIMAEIFAPNSSITHEGSFADFLVPYQKLIETHCNTYLTRCDFPNNEFLKDIAVDGIYKKMYKLAMIELFRFDMEFRIEKDIDELNKVGLLQSSTNILNFSFLHDSVRDYFISHFLNLWLEGNLVCSDWEIDTYLLQNFLLKEQHKDIRIFLNCYLRTSTVSLNTVSICRERLKKLYTKNENLVFNEQDSFYHVCLAENLNFLFQNFLIELIEDENISIALLCKRNFELKTPLFLLLENVSSFDELDENNILSVFLKRIDQLPIQHIKAILLSTFFTYFTTLDQFSGIAKVSNNYENVYSVLINIQEPFTQINDFLTACLRNKSKNLIKMLYSYDDEVKKYLVSVTNSSKQTGLHLTISEKIILELLKFGADINYQDYHGLTPLLRSIIGNKTETALLLIKEGADVTIPDNFNNSPLMHAAKNGNEEIVNVLLDSNQVDVRGCNKFGTTALMLAARNGNKNIVKSLLEKRVSVNEVDQTGLSALFHCIKTNQIHLVKLFKQYNADLDVQDIYGVTPLLDSIKKSNWNAVNTLLDNGADPFIESHSDDYPIKVLIQKEKTNILKKILTNTHEVITSSDVESFKYLNDYDKAYIYKHVLNKTTS
ncbi:hypothetical protein RN001_007500 [Aquatica leii]|uniref:NACHT domain-containing protein n=1 Tax=Aquatica leii TaxID=1421715 RepID=A0AAN7P8U1_9COLE|nr:hypothetical protein RN001_007500 [Aquatica leii]